IDFLPDPLSPAIDHGSNILCKQAGKTDQRTFPRRQGPTCDIGAVEARGAEVGVLLGGRGGNQTTSNLYSIDRTAGTATSIGPIGFAITGMSFDPLNGTLYADTTSHSTANPTSF